MKLRTVCAALALACPLLLTLPGCTSDGGLKPSARATLETASTWAHRLSTTAHVLIVGVTASCSDNPSRFCDTAMPIVGLASGALALFDQALAAADTALANAGSSDEQLAQAMTDIIRLEREVESFIQQLKVQQSLLLSDTGDGA